MLCSASNVSGALGRTRWIRLTVGESDVWSASHPGTANTAGVISHTMMTSPEAPKAAPPTLSSRRACLERIFTATRLPRSMPTD